MQAGWRASKVGKHKKYLPLLDTELGKCLVGTGISSNYYDILCEDENEYSPEPIKNNAENWEDDQTVVV